MVVLVAGEYEPYGVAAPPILGHQFAQAAIEKQGSHLDLNQPGAGAGPGAGVGRQSCPEVLGFGAAHGPNPVQAQRGPDRRETHDEKQSFKYPIDPISHHRITTVVGKLPDQDNPFYPGGSPSDHECEAARKKKSVKNHPFPRGIEIEKNRLFPGIMIIQDKLAGHPAGRPPKIEKIGCRQRVMEQKGAANANTREPPRGMSGHSGTKFATKSRQGRQTPSDQQQRVSRRWTFDHSHREHGDQRWIHGVLPAQIVLRHEIPLLIVQKGD